MVFTHNKQLSGEDDCYRFAYKHPGQLDCGGHLSSLTDFPSFRGIPEKHPISEGESEGIPSKSEKKQILGGDSINVLSVTAKDEFRSKAGDISNYVAASACRDISNMPWITNITGEVVGLEHLKRPFSDNGSLQVAHKRPRQADQDNQVDSYGGISSFGHTNKEPHVSVAGLEEIGEGKLAVDFEDHKNKAPNCNLNLSWFKSSAIVEDTRKLVPIGPNHQADLPLWRPRGSVNSSVLDASLSLGSASSDLMDDEDNSTRWMGTCILPMPDPNSLVLEEGVVNSKTLCHCFDKGSIRCVRHHILEAREKLKKRLGQDKFRELGFYDMGEGVAHKWTEEEQHLFDEVVFSNPIALHKNFWEDLPKAFPLRSTKELASYYFNVFILQKRAKQNRSDPLSADSDNDEWQESDSEFEGIGEYEDSDVESPVDVKDAICNSDLNTDAQIHEGYDDRDGCQDCDGDKLFDVSEGYLGDKSNFVPKLQLLAKKSNSDGKDQDSQDGSCTSYEGQRGKVDFCSGLDEFVETHDSLVDQMLYENSGFSSIYNQGHCDPTAWDMGYISLKEKGDFLPTSSVIEEVLGKESGRDAVEGQ